MVLVFTSAAALSGGVKMQITANESAVSAPHSLRFGVSTVV